MRLIGWVEMSVYLTTLFLSLFLFDIYFPFFEAVLLLYLGFMFNLHRRMERDIVGKSFFLSLEIYNVMVALVLLYLIVATIADIYFGANFPPPNIGWEWGEQFFMFPILILKSVLTGAFLGVMIGLLLKYFYRESD